MQSEWTCALPSRRTQRGDGSDREEQDGDTAAEWQQGEVGRLPSR